MKEKQRTCNTVTQVYSNEYRAAGAVPFNLRPVTHMVRGIDRRESALESAAFSISTNMFPHAYRASLMLSDALLERL